jgi:hypothetical protein
MDNYIELAHRTSGDSANNYLGRVDRTDFDRVFNGFEACSRAAERLKKMVFYGRDLSPVPTIDPATRNCPYDAESLHANLGVMGEAHEFVNADTREKVLDEGGDLLWYIAKKFRLHGITFDEAMENNIAKLKARYPDKFDADIARNLTSSVHE